MLLDIQLMRPDDYVGFTFFIGYMAMFAASVFFFFERSGLLFFMINPPLQVYQNNYLEELV